MYQLRAYQQDAVSAALDWITKSIEPCLLELATGAGKSLIVASLARAIHQKSGKKILCMAPSKELVEQNGQKYKDYGYDCSFYGGGLGRSLRYDVIFGTPDTIKNHLGSFGSDFAAVIYDEAHRITPSVIKIISSMRTANPQLRVIGMTATPYRLNDGYIYQYDEYTRPVPEDQTKNPFFHTLVYRITAPELIAMGFLTQPHADPNHAPSYDVSGLTSHTQAAYEKAFEGKGRKTAEIIADVVGHAHNRMGVMIFAATIQHANECVASLPPELTRIITGETGSKDREQIISDFKARRFKYLVNVSVLTTGFDAAHVDLIAILRSTESASLLQQIIGRGMRLHPQKTDCLILDYAENIERHQLESDLFTPIIQARHNKSGVQMEVPCPICPMINSFAARPNPEDMPVDDEGYYCDLEGNRVKTEDDQDHPAHYGRRCFGYRLVNGKGDRCSHKWAFKSCHECEHENDIAARFCKECKAELVDPNEKLRLDFHKMKANPCVMSTDEVRSLHVQKHVSKAGNETLKASYVTDYAKFDVWYQPNSTVPKFRGQYDLFSMAFYGKVAPSIEVFLDHLDKGRTPRTITYMRTKGQKFWTIHGYNKELEIEPET
jgi:DNA repair protein RadD